ncbi:hypothetical protein JK359_30100 [Streptomyces actinomycinicus]|uniref:Serine protease n=1 Tax=Streptomyces actinomycinicus TaxID=1695166 RepID=A0A937ENH8_9ACTN|nr:hypothetical protein [Streptomyces actinomycinicus]MBL1086166.1 hypothetical protein [Streptomyces actinomycinicus]
MSGCMMALLLVLVWSSPAGAAPASRLNDPQPHRGGARITMLGADCTSGFAVRREQDGKRAMATAGHCPAARIQVEATSGEFRFGTFVKAFWDDEVDASLITGTRARPQVYAPTIWVDGGVPGAPVARRVLGTADAPVAGQKVCTSGSYTRLVCDIEVTSLTDGENCEEVPPHRCTLGLAVGDKPDQDIAQKGDSGAPVFVPIDTVIDGHRVYGAMIVGMLLGVGTSPGGHRDYIVFHTLKAVECALSVRVLTTADAESGDTTPPPPRTDCAHPVP